MIISIINKYFQESATLTTPQKMANANKDRKISPHKEICRSREVPEGGRLQVN
jgi:hypothetical protein